MLKRLFNLIAVQWRFPMLKKLIKYGNSNALIFDKAILELLNIEEGAVVKISTNGKAIIITPHEKVTAEKISETYTNNEATADFIVNSYLNQYKNIDETKRAALTQELREILVRQKNITEDLSKNPDFMKEWQTVAKQSLTKGASLYEHKKLYDETKAKYSAAQDTLNKKIKEWEHKHNLIRKDELKATPPRNEKVSNDKQQGDLLVDLGILKSKEAELLNNPQYQHELQLIVEQYKNNQDSLEYLKALQKLGVKYMPELKKLNHSK